MEGCLNIDLQRTGTRRLSATAQSDRPVHAAKVLVGKSPDQALATVSLLFSVCGAAQSQAALTAVRQGIGRPSDTATEAARDLIVLAETAREHLLRIFLDWPRLFDINTPTIELAAIARMVTDFRYALFERGDAFSLSSRIPTSCTAARKKNTGRLIDQFENLLQSRLFLLPVEQWLAIGDINALQDWAAHTDSPAAMSVRIICERGWASQGALEQAALPELDDIWLYNRLTEADADSFVACPTIAGSCCETTPLTRRAGSPLIQSLHREFRTGLVTRWTARLVELAILPGKMRRLLERLVETAHPVSPDGHGIAQVEAARGRLIHYSRIDGGAIADYRIVAPTEWNFHPQGLVSQTLARLVASTDAELEQLARLTINAIDPCVDYRLRIH